MNNLGLDKHEVRRRSDILKQAKHEVKPPLMCRGWVMFILGGLSLVVDSFSMYSLQDLLCPSNKYLAIVIVFGICLFVDLLVPFLLPSLLIDTGNIEYTRVHKFFTKAVIGCVIAVVVLLVLQRVSATSVIMGEDLMNLTAPKFTQYMTQFFYALIPVMTTIGLTSLSISAHHYKVILKKKFLRLLILQIDDEEIEVTGETKKVSEGFYQTDDDAQYQATALEILAKGDILLQSSREILCQSLGSPQSTDYVLSDIPTLRLDEDGRAVLTTTQDPEYVEEEKIVC